MIRDYRVAFEKAQTEAEGGDLDAQARLGTMYGLGLGCAQDYFEAIRWHRLAARGGHLRAQSNLGFMYGTGRGVPQDFVHAYAWYNLAAAAGEEHGRDNREVVAARMTPNQIERAQDLSRELFDRFGAGSLD